MHETAKNFFEGIQRRFAECLNENTRILDCGSRDVNGSSKEFFPGCKYDGLDKEEGRNVNIVSLIHEFTTIFKYDVVMTCSTLEHSEYWQKDLRNMYELLKAGGLLVVATVCKNYGEHGTLTHPGENGELYGTSPHYYRNIDKEDFETVFNLAEQFSEYELTETPENDLFFWGIKK